MNTAPTWSNSSIHDEIRESGLDCVNRPTPETNKLADTLHRDDSPLVIRCHKMMMNSQRLERERDEARDEIDSMYHKIIKEVLECDPIPACKREDDHLEPPWEVIARIRDQRDKLADACRNLIDVKGRHNTEIAFNKMKDVFQSLKTKEL